MKGGGWYGALKWAVFAAAIFLAVLGPVLGVPVGLAALSPLVSLGSVLAAPGAGGWVALAGLAFVPLLLWRRRWFCRWMCPTGKMLDGCRLFCPRPVKVPRLKLRPVGIWLFCLAVGGAVLGFPLLLWLDPLALLGGTGNGWHSGWTAAGVAAALGLPLLLVLEWLQPRLWCGRLCPLGGMQDFVMGVRQVLGRMARRWSARAEAGRVKAGVDRRSWLGLLAGGAAVWGGRLTGWGAGETVIRPPGAAPEEKFGGLCVRCGNCVAACPSKILRPDLGRAGVGGLLAPVADFAVDYCRENCANCVDVCPSGALARVSLERKQRWVMGVARVHLDFCLLASGTECTECVVRCPYRAVSVVSSEDGFGSQPLVDVELCIGCGACEAYCPVRAVEGPRRAIEVEPVRAAGVSVQP